MKKSTRIKADLMNEGFETLIQFANYIGTSRQSVSMVVNELAATKWIRAKIQEVTGRVYWSD